jgi:hypothetical protein
MHGTATGPGRQTFAYCDRPLPIQAGESPFRIKGEFYRQLMDSAGYHDRKTAGGVGRILEREGLAQFATQNFLSSALYDALPVPRIVMAIAEATGRDLYELAARQGRASVEGQINGVYAPFFSALTVKNFGERFGRIVQHFYDFAPISVRAVPGGAEVERVGVPLCFADWWNVATGAFATLPLEVAGARNVRLHVRDIEPTGVDRGVEVGRSFWTLTWDDPG